MSKRKGLSRKVRFDVFKRDSFTCQYCGDKAPDVILHVDHIDPVKEGGDNNILNLITSCQPCNAGKGATRISDNSTVIKQRAQLDDLAERRSQLEMMMLWREELDLINDYRISKLVASIQEYFHCKINENGKTKLRKWAKKYAADQILDAADICRDQYLEFGKDGHPTNESTNKAFNYIPRVCACRIKEKDKPYIKDIYYIHGILRNRMYLPERLPFFDDMDYAFHYLHISVDLIAAEAKEVANWKDFKTVLFVHIEMAEGKMNG